MPSKQAIKQRIKRERRMRHLNRWRLSKGCEQCGWAEHIAGLQWAHKEPVLRNNSSKCKYARNQSLSDQPRAIAGGAKLSTLMAAVRKHKILCANCHAIETYEDGLQFGKKVN